MSATSGVPAAPPPRRPDPRAVAVLDAVLSTARALLGCELVALNVLSADAVRTARAQGHLPGLGPGVRARRTDTLCHLLLADAEPAAGVFPRDAALGAAPAVARLGLGTYVGVPVRDGADRVVGTLCGFDRRVLPVDDRAVAVLEGLARVLAPWADELAEVDAGVVRAGGQWRVEGVDPDGTGTALASLLGDGVDVPPVREHDWLVANVAQLEQAIDARVAVEQAVGRVAERLSAPPLTAFRLLREASGRAPVHAAALREAEGVVHRGATE